MTAENRHLAYLLGEDIGIQLHRGDCLDVMAALEPGSVDLVLTDPPYGTTACKWDSVIPFEPMWERIHRVAKPNAAVVLFGSQPFTSVLGASQVSMLKYSWVWDKVRPSGFQIAKHRPMMRHEDILVFGKSTVKYNRQMTPRDKPIKGKVYGKSESSPLAHSDGDVRTYSEKNPQSILVYVKGSDGKHVHPTQKPVALMEYLIKTYTDEGDTVLDFTMGSGTTGVACLNTNRRFIGIELDPTYFEIAEKRILTHQTP
jgi:site-specific DNA-methyltransferase (adenine-specific)